MRNKLWDSFESLLAERILVDGLSVRKAVPEICRAFPEDPVGYLILAYVMTAVLRGSEARRDPEAPPPGPATKVALRCGATTVLVEPLDVAWARAAMTE